jgi:hypothetical protein
MANSSIDKLWPAYNANAAPQQASTEGLFQQTRLITAVTRATTFGLMQRKATQTSGRRVVSCDLRYFRKKP